MSEKDKGILPITDTRMTRFMITLESSVNLVWHAFDDMEGGEIYVPKIPSMKITDIARVVAPEAKQEVIGIRPGEKLHEQMIGADDSYSTYNYPDYYKILPRIYNWGHDKTRVKSGVRVQEGFTYSSETNKEWMSDQQLQQWLMEKQDYIGKI